MFTQLSIFLKKCLPVRLSFFTANELVLTCSSSHILIICSFLLKQSYLQFKTLSSISGVDFLTKVNRFEIIYDFLSIHYNFRVRLKTYTTALATTFCSLTSLFQCANWWEREIWDLFGVYFSGNSDLRRLLLDYGFEGFPLRKDFPVSGFVELAYSYSTKTCRYSSLELSQRSKLLMLQSSIF